MTPTWHEQNWIWDSCTVSELLNVFTRLCFEMTTNNTDKITIKHKWKLSPNLSIIRWLRIFEYAYITLTITGFYRWLKCNSSRRSKTTRCSTEFCCSMATRNSIATCSSTETCKVLYLSEFAEGCCWDNLSITFLYLC